MAIPIAAILAAAQLISSGVGKIGEKRRIKRQAEEDLYEQGMSNYQDAAQRSASRAGGDTSAAHEIRAGNDMRRRVFGARDDALAEVEDRPVDYGAIGGLVQGTTGAIGAGPKGPGGGGAPRISIGAPNPNAPTGGYISPSRVQAPLAIGGPQVPPNQREDWDPDWFGSY